MSYATHCIPYDKDCVICNPAASPVSEPRPLTGVGVRGCRGHWHLAYFDNGVEGEDISIRGDPFKTRETAQVVADRLNAGESYASVNAAPAVSPSGGAPSEASSLSASLLADIEGGYERGMAQHERDVKDLITKYEADRAARLVAETRATAWQEVAEHVRGCVECGETDVLRCDYGKPLWVAALAATPDSGDAT